MLFQRSALKLFSFLGALLLALGMLAACGSSDTGNSGGTTPTAANSTPTTAPPSSIQLTVGGKLDTEAQLLTKMYVLLLRKAGYQVTEKAGLGTNDVVFNAIKSGAIDLYPEFTATGLFRLNEKTTNNPDQDYQTVKQGFESKYQITWLDKSPLNDTYGICGPKDSAKLKGITSISQLASIASSLSVATPPDGVKAGVDAVKTTYGFSFGGGVTTYNDVALTFPAVATGKQDVNVCYTTSALIPKNKFTLLQDDKNAFPAYNPAPIVRDDTLAKAPGIKDALNPLAPLLTTEVSQNLQLEVANGQTVTAVATKFLQDNKLL